MRTDRLTATTLRFRLAGPGVGRAQVDLEVVTTTASGRTERWSSGFAHDDVDLGPLVRGEGVAGYPELVRSLFDDRVADMREHGIALDGELGDLSAVALDVDEDVEAVVRQLRG